MMRLGARSSGQGKRERPTSQERELESRPAKRPNLDDDPEEGELEDDSPPPATASQQAASSSASSSLPPRPPNLPLPPRPVGTATASTSSKVDPHSDARGSDNSKKSSGVKTVAFPFKMKPKPAQPAQAEPSRMVDNNTGSASPSRSFLPAGLPPKPTFAAAPAATSAPKDDDRRPSPSKRDRRAYSPEQRDAASRPARGRSRERETRRGYDEYYREDERYYRSSQRGGGGAYGGPSDNGSPPRGAAAAADDWRTRREDEPYYDSRGYRPGERDWEKRDRDGYYPREDRDRHYRPVSPSPPPPARHRYDSSRPSHSRSPSPAGSAKSQHYHHNRRPSPSRSPRSRSRSLSSGEERSSGSPRQRDSHHPSRLPKRVAARPMSPARLPRPLPRDDVEMDDPYATGPGGAPPSRTFQPFNMKPKGNDAAAAAASRPQPPENPVPHAPKPDYEPQSVPHPTAPTSQYGGGVLSTPFPSSTGKSKNLLGGEEEEDEGEVKESQPHRASSRPLLPPLSQLEEGETESSAVAPSAPATQPPQFEKKPGESEPDAIQRKIWEMEALASQKGPVPPAPATKDAAPPPPKPAGYAPAPAAVSSRPILRPRNEQQEVVAYSRAFKGVSGIDKYARGKKLGEGTFGQVFEATHKETRAVVALKKILMHNESQGLPITAVREIKLLKKLKHPNVIELVDLVFSDPTPEDKQKNGNDRKIIWMAFPYMDHDLAGLLKNPTISLQPSHIKLFMKQLLEGTSYLHRNHILHRDIKSANLLIDKEGCLKIADFGLARPISKEWGAKRGFTNCVVTRWYRPPELLLGAKVYDGAVDMWGIGCILAEMFERNPIMQGQEDIHQLTLIFQLCGTPDESTWPGWRQLPGAEGYQPVHHQRMIGQRFRMLNNETSDLLIGLLTLDPSRRLTADQALDHVYFWKDPLPAPLGSIPKEWRPSKEHDTMERQPQRGGINYRPVEPDQVNYQRHGGGRHYHRQDYGHGLPPPTMGPGGGGHRVDRGGPPGPSQSHMAPPPASLPPLRWTDGAAPPPIPQPPMHHHQRHHLSHPSGLPQRPPPPPPPQGLPGPAFGGDSGYTGPIHRGGRYPERPYHTSSSGRGPGGGGTRGGGGRGDNPGGGGLPYD
ncbi:serine/threonine protein kinase, CMGC, CDC2/CDK sub [Tulasnella sp. 424]|nr:serine/threonine protein kinase, CMGC, CDC2/CDK sub [Tulasnella sp. 424]